MTFTKTLPAVTMRSLELREGDTLQVIATTDSSCTVCITREDEPPLTREPGAIAEWLRASMGVVKLAPGETADDLRMDYYREKYKLDE